MPPNRQSWGLKSSLKIAFDLYLGLYYILYLSLSYFAYKLAEDFKAEIM